MTETMMSPVFEVGDEVRVRLGAGHFDGEIEQVLGDYAVVRNLNVNISRKVPIFALKSMAEIEAVEKAHQDEIRAAQAAAQAEARRREEERAEARRKEEEERAEARRKREEERRITCAQLSHYLSYEQLLVANPAAGRGIEFDETLNPELTKQLDDHCIKNGIMIIGCNPSYLSDAENILKGRGLAHLSRYLQIGKEKGETESGGESHGWYCIIMIPDPDIKDIDVTLGVYFNPYRLRSRGMYLLSKLSYTQRLLDKVCMQERPEDGSGEDTVLTA